MAMLRYLLFWGFALFLALSSCEPPVRVRATDKKTTRDSVHYVGIAEVKSDIDLRKAELIGTVKVGDRGATLDCRYPDVLEYACRNAGRIGGNLLVITKHQRNEVKSNCHVIKGEIYRVVSLEGLESRMYWHPERRLAKGDLRQERSSAAADGWPPVSVLITCRLGGDFFKEVIIRTETLFFPDSAGRGESPRLNALAVRRAQVLFDAAEVHARQLKADLVAIGPDLDRLINEYRPRTEERLRQLRADQAVLDAELSANADAEAVLARWEATIRQRLIALEPFAGHQRIDLRKRKRS